MSVEQLVGQGRFTHVGLWQSYSAKDREAVEWALASTGLAGLAARGPKEFSGGERHRAWIAASLAQEADILILDGPTSFLDIGHQVEVLELLVRLNQERGVTVIMAMHDINQAMMVSESTSLLDRGVLELAVWPIVWPAAGWWSQHSRFRASLSRYAKAVHRISRSRSLVVEDAEASRPPVARL